MVGGGWRDGSPPLKYSQEDAHTLIATMQAHALNGGGTVTVTSQYVAILATLSSDPRTSLTVSEIPFRSVRVERDRRKANAVLQAASYELRATSYELQASSGH